MKPIIFIDGIDKTGKDTLIEYVNVLSGHSLMVYDRGPISNLAYAKLFNRKINYDINDFKSYFYVYLTAQYDDWKVRCDLRNEPAIDYNRHINAFEDILDEFLRNWIQVLRYDTTHITPYDIAKDIITKYRSKYMS